MMNYILYTLTENAIGVPFTKDLKDNTKLSVVQIHVVLDRSFLKMVRAKTVHLISWFQRIESLASNRLVWRTK